MAGANDIKEALYFDAAMLLFQDIKTTRYTFNGGNALPAVIDNEAKLVAHLRTGGAAEAYRDLGGTRDIVKFEYQLMAASNPTGYAALKLAELKKIETTTTAAFTASFDRFMEAGYSRDAARAMALAAADNVKRQDTLAMKMAFGEDDVAVFKKALDNEASQRINHVAESVVHHGPEGQRRQIEYSAPKKHKKHKAGKKHAALKVD